ncbi:Crp/Fnr family transcriptional regulator [Anaeroarcus burkinensis]|uniref:Crp/Fnr family transcriptional regulator n=1 Tax=Anaeroarcus burkinensis TaxID=82376 RepID=UPI00041ACABF|nr:Crp/Fnr family transcriptional regulator [Anaeroarcus burkinensis]
MEYLKQVPLFGDLPTEVLQRIDAVVLERTYKKGESIFLEGEPGEGLHFVRTGRVKIVKTAEDGREHIIKFLKAGEIFAEVLLFNHLPYPAASIAVEDSRIGLIRNEDLEKLILENNALALLLIRSLSQRLLYAQQKIKELALQDVPARTAELLLRLSREQGKRDAAGKPLLELPESRQELAGLMGTSRETLSRTLSDFKKRKWISMEGNRIVLLQEEQLLELSS